MTSFFQSESSSTSQLSSSHISANVLWMPKQWRVFNHIPNVWNFLKFRLQVCEIRTLISLPKVTTCLSAHQTLWHFSSYSRVLSTLLGFTPQLSIVMCTLVPVTRSKWKISARKLQSNSSHYRSVNIPVYNPSHFRNIRTKFNNAPIHWQFWLIFTHTNDARDVVA